jgi:hypothetical protein
MGTYIIIGNEIISRSTGRNLTANCTGHIYQQVAGQSTIVWTLNGYRMPRSVQ